MGSEREQTVTLTHEEAFELLSWYVNKSLTEKVSAKVKAHVSFCAECQQEIEMLNELKSAILFSDESLQPEPSADVFNSVMNRVEEYEATRPDRIVSRTFTDRLRAFFSDTFGSWNTFSKLAFAGQFAVLILLIGGLWFSLQRSRGFETLAAQEKSRADQNEKLLKEANEIYTVLAGTNGVDLTNAVRINIAFQEQASEKEIRGLLNDINATIINGPSPQSFYVIALPVAKDARDSDKQKVLGEALEKLRANSKVIKFAEEMTG